MSGGGGGGGDTTTTVEPWRKDVVNRFVNQAEAMPQLQPTGNRLVANLTPQQRAGISGIEGTAGQALPNFQQIAGGALMGGVPTDVATGMAQGGGDSAVAMPAAQSALDFSRDIATTPELLERTAAGEMLMANPYADAAFQAAADPLTRQFREATMPSIDAAAARAGRLGSPAAQRMAQGAQEELGRSLGNLGTSIYGQAYETAADRALRSATALPGIQQQQLAGQLGAAGQVGQLEAADINRRLAGAQLLQAFEEGDVQTALAGLQGGTAAGSALMGAGGALQQQRERMLAERERLARQEADTAYQDLQRRWSLLGPSAFGSQVQTTSGGGPAGPSLMAGAAGGALSGAAIGAGAGPWGAGIGAAGGALIGGLGTM